ncbi:transporter substrate-binding domain-containing protein [Pelomonas sp. SE-A7]|uniref:substrate-binding periplasmic protein n=1 Tax=Pelomonas sp. SE-A7 TaxID=3054953 RepID=UPI00259D27AA|nr:transporter substrate-binding domain-containing protein [Pelomonas sp. SE-A7]MDM4766732.1 transporter substrate-binding domain-containing protein [Pelomonas sp. SE-A7]
MPAQADEPPSPAARHPDERRRKLLACLAAASLGSARAWAPQPVPVAIGENSSRPFVEPLLKLIGESAGISWQLQSAPWARVLALAERGQSLAFGMARTTEREKLYAFSQPVFDNHVWMLIRRDQALDFRSLDDLRDRTVCISRGTSYGGRFDAIKGKQVRVEYVDGDLGARLRMLIAGRCDMTLGSHRSPDPWLIERRARQLSGLGAAIAVLPVPLAVEPVHFGVGHGSPLEALLPRIDQAVKRQRVAIRALVDSEL